MNTELGSFVCMYEGSEMWNVCIEDAPRIDAGVSRYIDSGGTADTLLDLTLLNGYELRIRASRVTAWFISTPDARLRAMELEKLQGEERAAHRTTLGIWDDDT